MPGRKRQRLSGDAQQNPQSGVQGAVDQQQLRQLLPGASLSFSASQDPAKLAAALEQVGISGYWGCDMNGAIAPSAWQQAPRMLADQLSLCS